MNETLLVFLNTASTLFMVGIIWFVQLVHYPLFLKASRDDFKEFSKLHSKYASYVVVAPMLVELITSILLLKWNPPLVPNYLFWTGFVFVVIIWFSTFLVQVASHKKLSNGYDDQEIKWLVKSNWVRTFAWTCRGIFVIIFLKGLGA